MIDIITIHCQANFGSALQAYALCRFLLDNKYENRVIDYRPDYIIGNGGGLKGMVKAWLFGKNGKTVRNKYDSFIKENVKLTPAVYKTYSELAENPPEADIYISGSDQLWNPNYTCGVDDSFKLSFVKSGLKISYATSVGTKNISENALSELSTSISDYFALSVREKSSSLILTKKTGRDVACVCDPVFLLKKQHYEKMCCENRYGDYVLVYLVNSSELLDSTMKKIKKYYNCSVIFACGNVAKCDCNLHIKDPGPLDMLSLIYHAKAVVTSSFHATSFSLIFGKDFYPITAVNNNERILSLLEISGFPDKSVSSVADLDRLNFDFDFSGARAALGKYSEASQEWLLEKISKAMMELSSEAEE